MTASSARTIAEVERCEVCVLPLSPSAMRLSQSSSVGAVIPGLFAGPKLTFNTNVSLSWTV